MAKATKAQIIQRLNAVVKLRLGGAAIREIFQYSQDHNWDVGDDAVYKYVGKADAIIAEHAERDRDRLLAFEVNARNRVFVRAMEKGDLEAALKVLKDRAQLLNLYPSKDPTPSAEPVHTVLPPRSDAGREAPRPRALARLGRADPEAIPLRGSPADRPTLPAPRAAPDRCGDDAQRLANEAQAGAEDSDAAPGQPAERENP
jgi:hypothetical protein